MIAVEYEYGPSDRSHFIWTWQKSGFCGPRTKIMCRIIIEKDRALRSLTGNDFTIKMISVYCKNKNTYGFLKV